jgi:hypothetical protein
MAPFNTSLTTNGRSRRSMCRFEASPTQGDSEGPKSFIFHTASLQQNLAYIKFLSVFVAHLDL